MARVLDSRGCPEFVVGSSATLCEKSPRAPEFMDRVAQECQTRWRIKNTDMREHVWDRILMFLSGWIVNVRECIDI